MHEAAVRLSFASGTSMREDHAGLRSRAFVLAQVRKLLLATPGEKPVPTTGFSPGVLDAAPGESQVCCVLAGWPCIRLATTLHLVS